MVLPVCNIHFILAVNIFDQMDRCLGTTVQRMVHIVRFCRTNMVKMLQYIMSICIVDEVLI